MAARHRNQADTTSSYARRSPDAGGWGLSPDDRAGMPMAPRPRSWLRWLVIGTLMAGGGAWAGGLVDVPPWLTGQIAALLNPTEPVKPDVKAAAELPAPPPIPSAPPSPAVAALPEVAPAAATVVTVPAEPGAVAAPTTLSATTQPSSSQPPRKPERDGAAASAAPWATDPSVTATLQDPPPPPPLDPLQRRAEAVGLNPDLSPTLLRRLSEADFRNAGTAIAKAVAETADNAALEWPAERRAGRAQFRVEFVEGAGAHCRRYVVTIAKDGWRTTALPMEKCGVRRVVAKAK